MTQTSSLTPRRFAAISATAFLLLTIAVFYQTLFSSTHVFCAFQSDLTGYYIPSRIYAFSRISQGHFPFWNDRVFSGTPYASNFQSALFYPPTWIYAILPPVPATNITLAFHFWLASFLTSLYAFRRTSLVIPSLLSGMAYSLSGGFYLHYFAGHLTVVCAAAWLPLLFHAFDVYLTGITGRSARRWIAIGALAVALPLLAGHPQTAYCAYLAAGFYFLFHLSYSPAKRRAIYLATAACILGFALSSIQLLPAAAFATESTRAAGLSKSSALEYSLTPENVLTSFLPHVLGDLSYRYYGRWFLWETSIFIGTIPLALAFVTFFLAPRGRRLLLLCLLLLLLAGVSTTLSSHLFDFFPGYSTFRGYGRFGLPLDFLLAISAADGLTLLLQHDPSRRRAVIALTALTFLLFLSIPILYFNHSIWQSLLSWLADSHETLAPPEALRSLPVFHESRAEALRQLWFAAISLGCLAGAILLWRRSPRPYYVTLFILTLTAADLLRVAYTDRSAVPAFENLPPAWQDAIPIPTSHSRVLTSVLIESNAAMTHNFFDAAGYDPTLLGRYARYLAISQDLPWQHVEFAPKLKHSSPLLDMLRVQSVLYQNPDHPPQAMTMQGIPMTHLTFLHHYVVKPTLDEACSALAAKSIDLRDQVLLEQNPSPAPSPDTVESTASILNSTPESLEITATTPTPALLLITDSYAKGWTATPLSAGPQDHYDVLPADLALRAIPLAAGTHHLRLQYTAPLFSMGLWISSVSAFLCVILLFLPCRKSSIPQ